jgi:hypothetical protein
MKKILLASALVLAIAVSAAVAQGEVLSQNAVGYIKVNLPANKFVSVAQPLNNMGKAENKFGETSIAQEAPQGTWVYFWNPVDQNWGGGVKAGAPKGWAGGQSNRVIVAGEGFFMKAPTNVEVTITGEVPDEAQLTRTIPGNMAFGSIANPYPVDFKFGESDAAKNASQGSWVYFWDITAQNWGGGVKAGAPKGWAGGQSNRVVMAGEGYFLKEAAGVTTVTTEKPYTWP